MTPKDRELANFIGSLAQDIGWAKTMQRVEETLASAIPEYATAAIMAIIAAGAIMLMAKVIKPWAAWPEKPSGEPEKPAAEPEMPNAQFRMPDSWDWRAGRSGNQKKAPVRGGLTATKDQPVAPGASFRPAEGETMDIIDISVPVREGETPIWPGNPGLKMRFHKSFKAGDSVCLTEAAIGVHTGTHLDAPMHYLRDQGGIETLPLEVLVGPARVIEVENPECVSAEELGTKNLEGASRFLIKTRNSKERWWEKPYDPHFCAMTPDAARLLLESGMTLLGVDYLSVDAPKTGAPVHLLLMPEGVVLLEGLNLGGAPEGDYELIALPALFAGRDGAPARAILRPLSASA